MTSSAKCKKEVWTAEFAHWFAFETVACHGTPLEDQAKMAFRSLILEIADRKGLDDEKFDAFFETAFSEEEPKDPDERIAWWAARMYLSVTRLRVITGSALKTPSTFLHLLRQNVPPAEFFIRWHEMAGDSELVPPEAPEVSSSINLLELAKK